MKAYRFATTLVVLACVTAIIPSAWAGPLIPVTAHITADNHYGLYFGSADGTSLTFVGRNEIGNVGNPGLFDWSLPETWNFAVDADQFIYVVAWDESPDLSLHMWIGDFASPDKVLVSNRTQWQSSAISTGWPGMYGTPALDDIQTAISSVTWGIPGVAAPNGYIWGGTGSTPFPGVDPLAQEIWHDAFVSTTSYTIYRARADQLAGVPEPSELLLLCIGLVGLTAFTRRWWVNPSEPKS